MRFLTNLPTQTKLFAVFGLLALVAALIAVGGIVRVADFQVQVTDLQAGVQALERCGRAQADLAREQVAIKNALLGDDAVEWSRVYDYGGQFYDFLNSPELYAAGDQVQEAMDENWEWTHPGPLLESRRSRSAPESVQEKSTGEPLLKSLSQCSHRHSLPPKSATNCFTSIKRSAR